MIVKAFEIKKINLDKTRLFLFYGENEGYKNEIIKKRFEKNYPNQIYRYDEKEIIDKKNDFFYSILSKSFFDNKKLIIISRITDKIRDIIEEIISINITDVTIILSANILEKKSKLRSFFEKEKNTICVPFYSDTNETMSNLSLNFFKKKKNFPGKKFCFFFFCFLLFFVIKSKKPKKIKKSEVWNELKKIVFKSAKKYFKKIFFFIIPA